MRSFSKALILVTLVTVSSLAGEPESRVASTHIADRGNRDDAVIATARAVTTSRFDMTAGAAETMQGGLAADATALLPSLGATRALRSHATRVADAAWLDTASPAFELEDAVKPRPAAFMPPNRDDSGELMLDLVVLPGVRVCEHYRCVREVPALDVFLAEMGVRAVLPVREDLRGLGSWSVDLRFHARIVGDSTEELHSAAAREWITSVGLTIGR